VPSATPSTSDTVGQPGGPRPAQLTGSDDFAVLDPGRWQVFHGDGGPPGFYNRANVAASDGEAHITARAGSTAGMCWCGPQAGRQTYGRWEIRARMDVGRGYGPTLLLWPDSGNEAVGGRIDIMTLPTGDRRRMVSTILYGSALRTAEHTETGDFTQWHTYAVDWQPGYLDLYLDGRRVQHLTDPAAIPRTPMHLAVQVDMGDGARMPKPDAATPATVALHLDWVRSYRGG
jgi:licheninase